ncbi:MULTISPECIES: Crp/Fnr family transcriptional regulator [Enterococcus]|jgi:CRP-like cAMP-binding protein|uniref:Transcriptional regulator n=1 Tax=Enterococcus dispar ATCC 51266 TaxID=1139219 RepID=S0KU03_9ENTE|nr:Crp/Fnr family transcriptional regulator [Enterococcus dispar]EOT42691.1 transcriptional regulator [Enterococcus dispar ATCC 51266]EOW84858.1 transcriptional regulator [Enterococcus dispar ATCC 51266]MCU7356196.1 Crp/Fnr family transcriptional regulator [Enterococcus dispar]MDT2704711.1 Crp/Fnr family transcriptional regulator [Enterococcus dispar]OJG38399.1 transcriptional regulator [Enterococcus dispar]
MYADKVDYQFSRLRYQADFEHLTEEEFQLLKANVLLRSYKKGQVLFDEGDARDRLYYVIEGLVRIERYDESATYYYYDYVSNNSVFPLGGVFEAEVYTHSAQAMTDIETFYFPTQIYEQICQKNNEQLLYLIKKQNKIIESHQLRLQTGLTSNAHDRVTQNLYILKRELGQQESKTKVTIPFPITLKELAVNSGTTRETAGQVIKKLKEKGFIDYDKKIFTFYEDAIK